YFTTDTAAVLRALEIEADILLKGTKVDGVYDRDPVKYPDATLFNTISYADYIELNLKFMDITAISLAKNNHLKIKVFNIKELGNISKAVFEDNFGSIIE
ncbi:uridine monophosphate kinase, partial [bacterium]|nr:uridine monophosphate kinase [bacterium]